MEPKREKVKRRTDKMIFKLLQKNADSEDEAAEVFMKDIDLEQFGRMLARMQQEITGLEEQLRKARTESSKKNECCCCCCGGCCK